MSKLDDTILRAERSSDFEDLKLRNHRRVHAVSASFRKSFLGQIVERVAFGNNVSEEQVDVAHDIQLLVILGKQLETWIKLLRYMSQQFKKQLRI